MKIHLLYSRDPLDEGQDQTALCASLIHAAHWLYQGGTEEKIDQWPNICRHCRNNFIPLKIVHMYLYGCCSGQDWETLRAKRGDHEAEV